MAKPALKKTAPAAAPEILPAVVNRIEAGQIARTKAQEAVVALARTLNYNGSTDPAVLENSAKDAIRRIGAGIFELGAYLLLLKETCERGHFLPALERLGISPDAGQRYMAVTRRFANAATSRHLEAVGMSKLVELLPLDTEQLEDLTEFGKTGELALDDVARMSVKELRAAVHKARADADKQKRRAERQDAVVADLHEEARAIKRLAPDEKANRVKVGAASVATDLQGRILGELRQAIVAVYDLGEEASQYDIFLAGLVGQVQRQLTELRQEFNLPDVSTARDQALAAQIAAYDKD